MPRFDLTDFDDVFPAPGIDTGRNDTIYGGYGNDLIDAGAGSDFIGDGFGRDTLRGGVGHDTISTRGTDTPGDDSIDGGAGIDQVTLDFTFAPTADVRAVLQTGAWRVTMNGVAATALEAVEQLYLFTGDGDDFLAGGRYRDTFITQGGSDTVRGGAGDDRVEKTFGHYDLDGGDGFDSLVVSDTRPADSGAGMVFDARSAIGTITVGTQTTGTFRNFEDFNIQGSMVNDRIYLGDSAPGSYFGHYAEGLGGDDTLVGGSGNDTLKGGGQRYSDIDSGNDVLYGNGGHDTIYTSMRGANVTRLADRAYGGAGDDYIIIDRDHAVIDSPAVSALGTIDFAGAVFDGGQGTDLLRIAPGDYDADVTRASITGVEVLNFFGFSLSGNRIVMFTRQVDPLIHIDIDGTLVLADNESLILDSEVSITTLQLAAGGQLSDLSATTSAFFRHEGVDILGGTGSDTITGSRGDEMVVGNNGHDILRGFAGLDTLIGGNGNDVLFAGSGPDQMYGGAGRDTLVGGGGADRMDGGAGGDRHTGHGGADQFMFSTVADSGINTDSRDWITDFTIDPAAGANFIDRINLAAIDARAATAANDAFQFIGSSAFTGEGQIRAVQSGVNTAIYVNTSGATAAEMSILLFNVNASLLSDADFVL